jgi:hypothetical protein
MNVAVGIWQPAGVTLDMERIQKQWKTQDWQGSCHSVQFFVASEEPARGLPHPKGAVAFERISRGPLIEEVLSQFQDHWIDHWMNRHREVFKILGIWTETIAMNEWEGYVETWLDEWLRFWASYQVIQRYYSTYYGDEPIDAIFLTSADFAFETESRLLGDLYRRVSEEPKFRAGREAAYRWPPLNGSNLVLTHKSDGRRTLLGGQSFTLAQLLNPKNIRLYFCEHFQLPPSAMPVDLDPFTCIGRLLEIQFKDFADELRPTVNATVTAVSAAEMPL